MEITAERSKPNTGSAKQMPGAQKTKYNGWEIATLPNELVVKILANLSIRDLLVCKYVCKHWQGLVTTVPTLACAAYHSCHPAGYTPRLNDTLKSYRGFTRQWLNGLGAPGNRAVTRLDGILASDGPHFPEQLFFAIAGVLERTPVFDCCRAYTIEHIGPAYHACFSPDEQHVFSYSDHTIKICSFVDGCWQDVGTFEQPAHIFGAHFSPDSNYLVVHLNNSHAKLWALTDGQWQQQVDWSPVIQSLPLFNADATHLLTVPRDDNGQIHSLIDGQWLPQVTALDHYPMSGARFHSKEPNLLATYYDNTVTIWRFIDRRWQQDGTLRHPHRVSNAFFSPDGSRLMTHYSRDRAKFATSVNIYTWHWVSREWREEAALVPTLAGYTAHFSPGGNYVLTATGRYQGDMEIWRLSRGRWEGIKTALPKNTLRGYFSPDQDHLVTHGFVFNANIWRCMDGLLRQEAVIPYCISWPRISFSPHGNHFVAAGDTKSAIIWGVYAGRWQEKARLPHARELCTICFSPHGNYVLTSTRDGTVNIWTLNRKPL